MKDKVVIITGASAGIGAELARQLGKSGAKLALAARDEARLHEVGDPFNALIVPTDVSDEAACKNLIDQTVAQYGKIDILVNNAGISMWAKFEDITDLSIFQRIMSVNFFGTVYCTSYALPYLKQSKGVIVGVSSLTGKTGVPTRTAYSASKHAMQGFLDSLRIELMGTGVDVMVASPGFVATEVRERALGADGEKLGASHIQEEGIMSAEECAHIMIEAMTARKRDVIISGTRSKLLPFLKVFAPKMVDNIARKAIDSGKT